jgi:hypothetical protein
MATKRYKEILATVKKNNPAFYEKLMRQEQGAKARAQKPEAKSNPLEGVTEEMIRAVRALNESSSQKPDRDYLALLKQYKADNPKATAQECIRAVNKAVPMARAKFIDGQKKAAAAQPDPERSKYSAEEIAGFMVALSEYRIKHKCGVYDAIKALDTLKPGLRQEHIKHINK